MLFSLRTFLSHMRDLKKIDNNANVRFEVSASLHIYMYAIYADNRGLTRQPGIRLVNQPHVAWNFDTILLNRLNDHHGIIMHKTENRSLFSSIIALANN